MRIVNKKYNINSNLNKKIILISDIHYYSKNDIPRLNKVLDNIKKINPDYICITGDIIDSSNVYDFNLLIEWLNKLVNVSNVMMVLGNHEFYVNKSNGIYKLNAEYINQLNMIDNLYFLDNKSMIIDNINFIGITLPIEHYMYNGEDKEEFKKYIKNIKTNNKYYNVLLCHSPINICEKEIIEKTNVDLVLCGHMHGGVVPRFLRPLFVSKGLISPQKKLFPNYAYGNIKIENKNVIITSGIKVLSESHFYLLRNVFSSEIVEIDL